MAMTSRNSSQPAQSHKTHRPPGPRTAAAPVHGEALPRSSNSPFQSFSMPPKGQIPARSQALQTVAAGARTRIRPSRYQGTATSWSAKIWREAESHPVLCHESHSPNVCTASVPIQQGILKERIVDNLALNSANHSIDLTSWAPCTRRSLCCFDLFCTPGSLNIIERFICYVVNKHKICPNGALPLARGRRAVGVHPSSRPSHG